MSTPTLPRISTAELLERARNAFRTADAIVEPPVPKKKKQFKKPDVPSLQTVVAQSEPVVRHRGYIKFYKPSGFGFIVRDESPYENNDTDFFFHIKDVLYATSERPPIQHDRVEFELVPHLKRGSIVAKNITYVESPRYEGTVQAIRRDKGFAFVRVDSLHFSNPCCPAGGDPRASSPTCSFPKERAASLAPPPLRPALVGCVVPMLVRLAAMSSLGSARHGPALAPQSFCLALDQKIALPSRQARSCGEHS